MGCFLACFGFPNNKKRRKPAYKRHHGSYEPLASSISIVRLGTAEDLATSADFEPRHKPKEQLSSKIRKKVSFNLNVQTYEPISTSYHFLKDEKVEKRREEIEEGSLSTSLSGSGSSNLNYRYQNCRDFYDEEDDIAFEDGDLDDYDIDDIDDNDGNSDIGSQRESKDGFSELVYTSCMSSEKKISSDEYPEEEANISSGADKKNCTHSVLKPVENLTQWRAAKAKTAPSKHQRKENNLSSQESSPPFIPMPMSKPLLLQKRLQHNQSKLLQEIAVDASLSSWLASQDTK